MLTQLLAFHQGIIHLASICYNSSSVCRRKEQMIQSFSVTEYFERGPLLPNVKALHLSVEFKSKLQLHLSHAFFPLCFSLCLSFKNLSAKHDRNP